jgi:anti-sigma B factor antagonist
MTRTESTIRTSSAQIPAPNPDDLVITVELGDGGAAVLRVTGEIDMRTAPELRRHVTEAVTTGNALVIDLEKVEFLASAGLSILVELAREASDTGLRWAVVATGRAVLRPIEAVGLLSIVPTHPTVADAVAAVNAV